jgi:methyl-accepting chemotaxis protein
MAIVDQVTQRNAAAAEELSSTAEELAAQAEALQALVAFFRFRGTPTDGASGGAGARSGPRRRGLGAAQADGVRTDFTASGNG